MSTNSIDNYNYIRPWLYPKQEDAIFDPARYAIIEAGTKSGKTVGCIIWLFEQSINGPPGANYWWVAPVEKQADIAWRRIKAAIPKDLYKSNENKKSLEIANDTTMWFKTAEIPDNLFGEDVFAAVIDEASRVKEESWHAVRSTLTATRGPARIIGNVKGKKNWAWKLARLAQKGHPDMSYHKITCWDAVEAGILDEREIDDARAMLPEAVFKELYMAEAADDGGNPFGLAHIEACVQYDMETGFPTTKPMGGDPVCWGWDVAKARNYTVGIALDIDGNVCRFHRWQDDWEATVTRIIRLTGGMPALVDSTGVGDQLVERLKRDGGLNFRGFKFTSQSKQELMLGLAVTIQNHEITFPAGDIVKELEMFEYEIRRDFVMYSAPEGYHDDCVDALALVVKMWRKQKQFTVFHSPVSLTQTSHWKSV